MEQARDGPCIVSIYIVLVRARTNLCMGRSVACPSANNNIKPIATQYQSLTIAAFHYHDRDHLLPQPPPRPASYQTISVEHGLHVPPILSFSAPSCFSSPANPASSSRCTVPKKKTAKIFLHPPSLPSQHRPLTTLRLNRPQPPIT